jgi:hypothetical protein
MSGRHRVSPMSPVYVLPMSPVCTPGKNPHPNPPPPAPRQGEGVGGRRSTGGGVPVRSGLPELGPWHETQRRSRTATEVAAYGRHEAPLRALQNAHGVVCRAQSPKGDFPLFVAAVSAAGSTRG